MTEFQCEKLSDLKTSSTPACCEAADVGRPLTKKVYSAGYILDIDLSILICDDTDTYFLFDRKNHDFFLDLNTSSYHDIIETEINLTQNFQLV